MAEETTTSKEREPDQNDGINTYQLKNSQQTLDLSASLRTSSFSEERVCQTPHSHFSPHKFPSPPPESPCWRSVAVTTRWTWEDIWHTYNQVVEEGKMCFPT